MFFGSLISQLTAGIPYILKNLPITSVFTKVFDKLNIDLPDFGKAIVNPIFSLICSVLDGVEKAINWIGGKIEDVVNTAVINPVNTVIGDISAKKVGWSTKVVGQKVGFNIQVTPTIKKLSKLNIPDAKITV